MSASALTRAIQRLEENVGVALFLRDNRGVALTEAGIIFSRYARQALLDWESMKSELSGNELTSGEISIYASVTAVYNLLPNLLEAFRTRYPSVQLSLKTGAAEDAVPQVLTGKFDLAVAALPDRQPGKLEFLPLRKTALVFIGPKDKSAVPMRDGSLDLATATLVLPSSGLSRRRLDTYLNKNSIRPQITTEVSGNEASIAMVRLGCGIGVVPELVLEKSPFRDEVQIIDQAPELAAYEVGLCSTQKSLKRRSVAALWELASSRDGLFKNPN